MVKEREYSLDLIKIIATTLIILTHYHQNFGGDYPLISYYNCRFYMGNIVELFFMLSGFFALHMVEKNERFPVFIGKRVRRLWPVMIIAALADQALLILYMALTGSLFGGRDLSLWGTVISAFGVQNIGIFFNQSVNNPTWYLSVLLLCYVLMFFLHFIAERTKTPPAFYYAVMIALGACILQRNWNAPLLNASTGRGYTAFFVGACLSLLCTRYRIHTRKSILWGALIFTVLFWIVFAVRYSAVEKDQRFICDFLLWPALILLFHSPVAVKIFNWPVLGICGNISFGTYVWHANVTKIFLIAATISGTLKALPARGPMIACCAASWLAGALSYYFLEKPIDRKIGHMLSRHVNKQTTL